jgi:hypothetical protein
MIAPLHHQPHLSPNDPTTYRVQVGHATATVQGHTVEEAIHEARRVFCEDMPRLWDAIHGLDNSRFTVVAVG